MGKVSVKNLQEGMVLASDLFAPNGRLVLPKGATLKASYLQTLKIWGVAEADIRGIGEEQVQSERMDAIDATVLRTCEDRVSRFFSTANREFEPVRELERLCVLRLAERLAKGEEIPEREPPGLPPGAAREAERATSLSAPDLVRREVKLFSFPDIYFRIKEVLDSPRSSATHIADVVSKDTSLSAKLLKLVNSSFYGFASRIDSITRAITIIGSNELSTLALGISAITLFKDVPETCVTMRSFWEHSIACGVYARILAGGRRIPSEERFFVSGLLHDIGRLILFRRMPHAVSAALYRSKERRLPLFEAESTELDYTHALIGGLLLNEWKLPPSIADIVRFHHSPMKAPTSIDSCVMHVADFVANAMRRGSSGSFFLPSLEEEAWGTLELAPTVFEPLVAQGERQIDEIVHVFLGS